MPTIATELWIATALLHREHPERMAFSGPEILEKRESLQLSRRRRGTLYAFVSQHIVANREPRTVRYRYLYRETNGHSHTVVARLFREGDDFDPQRRGAPVAPETGDIPEEYRPLLDWYWTEYNRPRRIAPEDDPILALEGVGKELWQSLGGVKFIEELRRGWTADEDLEAGS